MIAKREVRSYSEKSGVWAGKYRNSHNLLHWHYDCELIYVEKGKINVFCEKRTHVLQKGDALFIDSEQIHNMNAIDPETVLVVIIFDYNIVKPYLGEFRLASPLLQNDYSIPEYYAKIRTILAEKRKLCGAYAARELLGLMLEIFGGEELTPRTETDSAKSFKRLLENVNANYADYKFEDGVRFMGMSEGYFSRYFHASAGITFSQYLNHVRTSNAVKLILENGELSMSEVSERCGFDTVRNFNRIFKQITGYTPSTLPRGYVLEDKYASSSEEAFVPDLFGCELIEETN